jgi:hypothetical protein
MRDPRHDSTAENVASHLLPGGNLIHAALDRQLMIWSDRGGASRHIGDRWAARSACVLSSTLGTQWPVPHAEPFTLAYVLRLDDVPEVAQEANRHHLENPDFFLFGVRQDGSTVLQAADAKFAADRIKPSQVSAEIVRNLLALRDGVTATLVRQTLTAQHLAEPTVVRGTFVVPASALTEYLLHRVTKGRQPSVDLLEVVQVAPEPETMFAGLPPAQIIGSLARLDALPVTPRTNLISAIYYFRLACACFYLWSELEKPILTLAPPTEPEPGRVAAEVAQRAARSTSAYELVATWAIDVEPHVRAREAVAAVATLPIRMRDLRARVESAVPGGDARIVRSIRRDLDIAFRQRLVASTGEVPADDPRTLRRILDDVASASRSLTGEMHALLDDLVAHYASDSDSSAAASN